MSAIENCRTAELGGHVARCENEKCGHTQIAADVLGIAPDDVEVVQGDTQAVPFGTGTFNSRSMALGGHVLRCENDTCGYTAIAYNSCLMGKSSNGELAAS